MNEIRDKNALEKCAYNGKVLNENFNRLMDMSKLTLTQIHRNTGVAIPTIKRIQSDPSANPTISTLLPLAELFGISVNQLVGYEPLPVDLSGYIERRNLWVKVPVIEWQQAINWPNTDIAKQCTKFISTDIDLSENVFALVVEDDSWDEFRKHSILVIDPALSPNNEDYVVVGNIKHNKAMLKRWLVHDGINYLQPPNPDFKTNMFDENYRVLGVITQVRVDMRNGTVSF